MTKRYEYPHLFSYYRKQYSYKIIATQYMTGSSICQVLTTINSITKVHMVMVPIGDVIDCEYISMLYSGRQG
jgi:hypothetical protein